jgi:hypothetical protein
MNTVVLTFLLLATASSRDARAQCTMHWQGPRVLEARDGRPAYVESPAVLRTSGGVALLGSPAFLWAERDTFDLGPSAGVLDTAAYLARLRSNHSLIGFTLGSDRAATPMQRPNAGIVRRLVAASGVDGTVHIVWFAPTAGSNDLQGDGAVWYAEQHDNQWTNPQLLLSADRLDWSGQKAALLVTHTSDVHLVVPYYRGRAGGIAYIRRTNGKWRTIETELSGLPSQATLQLIGADSLAVAFAGVGAKGVRVRNGQHVYLIRASRSDSVWSNPKLIYWSGLDAIRWLKLYKNSSTRRESQKLILVWDRISSGGRDSNDVLYAMASDDGGASWRPPDSLDLPFKVADLTQDRDWMGNVHVAVTAAGLPRQTTTRMYHTALINDHWTQLDSVQTGPVASAPTLASIGRDTLLLVWGNARAADPRSPGIVAPVSEYVRLVRECASHVQPQFSMSASR